MSIDTSKQDKEKQLKLMKFRDHLNKQIILLTDKYQLPDITGVGKQVPWAIDIRIKFVEVYDKRISDLTPDVAQRILVCVASHVDSRWWIDHKGSAFDDIVQELFSEIPAQMPLNTAPICFASIDTQDTLLLRVTANNIDRITTIMQKYLFYTDIEKGGGVWIRDLPISNPERIGIVESLSLSLLQNGFTLQILTSPPPEIIHDGTVDIIQGKLCVVARTENVYKAVSRLGSRIIWIDTHFTDKLRILMKKYDIDCTNEATIYLNGDKI